MGFRSLIARQVQAAFRTLGTDADGLAPMHSYVSVGDPVYNPATRTATAPETVHANVPMVMTRFTLDDLDENIRPSTDRKVLIAALDLPVKPSGDDRIIHNNGTVYNVVRVLGDPAEALHIIHIRRQ